MTYDIDAIEHRGLNVITDINISHYVMHNALQTHLYVQPLYYIFSRSVDG